MRKDTLESNYYPGEISFHCWRQKWYISKLWAKINGDEGSGNCAWTKTFKFNVIVKHEKSSFQVSITSNWNAFTAIFHSPPNIVLCKLNGPDKELVWKWRVLFLNKVKFRFDDSTARKSPAKHVLQARRQRIFSFSVSFSSTSSG